MTAPRPREQRRPPSPPNTRPSRRGGGSSRYTYAATAAGRSTGPARRGLVRAVRALAAAALLALSSALAMPGTAEAQTDNTMTSGICGRTRQVQEEILSQVATDVCGEVTAAQLAGISFLDLDGESITSLRPGDFAGLTGLTRLDLYSNTVAQLPAGVFSGLTRLEQLYLQDNGLTSLRAEVFSGLTRLAQLRLDGNSLSSLPAGVFEGLTSLTRLYLHRNTVDPLPLEVTVEKAGTNRVRAKVLAGAPFAVDIPVTVANGSLPGSVLPVPAGSVNGPPVKVTRKSGTTKPVTVEIELSTQPSLPGPDHRGYKFAKAVGSESAEILPKRATIDDIDVVSTPRLRSRGASKPDTYGEGETIRNAVEFDQTVHVEGEPTMALEVGSPCRSVCEAHYESGSGTDTLVFAYLVLEVDIDRDGIAIRNNPIEVVYGDSIRNDAGEEARLSYRGGRASGHKVDGSRTAEPYLSVEDAEAHEADGEMVFTVRLEPHGLGIVEVDYATRNNSGDEAVPGEDYTETRGTLRFNPLETERTVTVPIIDDTNEDDGETFRLRLSNPKGAKLGDREARGRIRNSDPLTAAFPASAFASSSHSGAADRPQVVVAFSEPVAEFAADTPSVSVTGGTVASVQPHAEDGLANAWVFFLVPDGGGDVTFALASEAACAAGGICTAGGRTLLVVPAAATIPGPGATEEPEGAPLTAEFVDMPGTHDGETGFRFRVAFSEPLSWMNGRRLREDVVAVTGGRATSAGRVDRRRDLWEVTVEPDSEADVTVTVAAGAACGTPAAVCTSDGRSLSETISTTVAGPPDEGPAPNTPATGAPTIAGTPRVGGTLTASTADISDADGLDNASFDYQWIRAGADIRGATGSTYTAVAADEGERLKVRVSFTDDAGNGESLTSAATEAVAARPVPLTAEFVDLPAEHDGESAFTFRIAFSAPLSWMNGRRLREDVVAVSGGRATSAGRVNRRRDLWELTVEPDSLADVTVTLAAGAACGTPAAVCTKDGRSLSETISATVRGPVGISVADARVEEGEGALLRFAVTLSRAASGTLTVDYATSDGSAHAGDDYRTASGTLSFRAGESSQRIEVAVLDDDHDEGEETLTLTLSNPSSGRLTDGAATGTIENRDPLPRALLARFGRTAAVHVVEQVEERLEARREPGFEGRFAGRALRPGMEREVAESFLRRLGGQAGAGSTRAGDPMADIHDPLGRRNGLSGAAGTSTRVGDALGGERGPEGALGGEGLLRLGLGGGDVLTGSGFALNRATRHGGTLSLWSRGAQSRFSGREGALSLGGAVRTTMFGADYVKGRLTAGLSLSHSGGVGEYAGHGLGEVVSSVTGLYPWLGYQATDRISVWGVAGYGSGTLSLTPEGGTALASDLGMALGALGARGELFGAAGYGLAFKADALWVGTSIEGVDGPSGRLAATSAAVTRLRTALEGSRDFRFGSGLSLKPSVEVGVRRDGGDAETGAGLDMGGGVVVSAPSVGLSVDVKVRMLLAHEAEEFRERGVSVSLSYNPTPATPFGLQARLAPSWGGQATSGAAALWGRETLSGMASGGLSAPGGRLDAELGYGLPLGRRLVGTPRLAVRSSGTGRDYRLGYGLGVLGDGPLRFELGIDAQRRESPLAGRTNHGVAARATLSW